MGCPGSGGLGGVFEVVMVDMHFAVCFVNAFLK